MLQRGSSADDRAAGTLLEPCMALGTMMRKPGAGKLFALGLFIQGGAATEAFPMWDLARLRIFGVLQRIAVCFLLASLLVLYVPESRMPVLEVQLSQPLHVLKCVFSFVYLC